MNADPPQTVVLHLTEADYRYGTGPLTLRVHGINRDPALIDKGEPWYHLRGVQLRADGSIGPARDVWVRARAVPPSLQP
ncbi:hypothetical protein [Dactylosporangium sp. CA-233914]|uniref:hypothetical protein n=1 Tax=Dactylosporangium sp. CA-233914 TaxID=3239934 RepID=UPI003D938274